MTHFYLINEQNLVFKKLCNPLNKFGLKLNEKKLR